MQDAGYRRCTKCGEVKPLGEFYKQKDCLGGRRRDCADCCRARTRAQKDRWRKQNPERAGEQSRRRMRANPDRRRRIEGKRRARKLAQFVEDVDPLVVLERDDGVCGICGGDVDPLAFHVDHIVALSHGGLHSYANVQAAHPFCNLGKGGSNRDRRLT